MQAVINSNGLVSIGTAASYLGYTVEWTRHLTREGRIPSVRFSSKSHRRYKMADLQAFRGEEPDDKSSEGGKVAILLRVSSKGQNRKSGENAKGSSLDNQREMVREYVVEKYGKECWQNAVRFERICSGLRYDDDTFVNLTKRILSGEFSRLIVKDESRLMRFGKEMFQQICEAGNCTIEFSHPVVTDSADSMSELTNDVLNILTCFTSRMSAKKAGDATRINMPPELVKEATALIRQGYSARHVERVFAKKGYKDEKGRVFRNHLIWRYVTRSNEVVSALCPDLVEKGSYSHFLKEKVRRVDSQKAMVNHKTLREAYVAWCEKGNYEPICDRTISQLMKKKEYVMAYNGHHSRCYKGISLLKR
jgi:predicted site-specific integrase-resolvase